MATTIEILLQSTFDPTGFDAAQAKAQEIVAGIKAGASGLSGETFLTFAEDIFPTGEATKFAAQTQEVVEQLRQLAIRAAEVDPELSKAIINASKSSQGLANDFKQLGGLTRTEIFKEFTRAGQSVSQMSAALSNAAKAEKQFAIAARESGRHIKAEIHEQRAAAIEREIASLDRLTRGTQELTRAQQLLGDFEDAFRDVRGVNAFKNKIAELREEFLGLRATALESGNVSEAIDAAAAVRNLGQIEQELVGVNFQFEQFGKAGPLASIINSRFNQLGFTLFITQNTIKSLINLVNSLGEAFFNTFKEIDRQRAFFKALQTGTTNVGELQIKLKELTAGFGDYNTVIEGAIKLSRALGGSQVDLADDFAQVARTIDIQTGGIVAFNETFNSLVDAVTSGDVGSLGVEFSDVAAGMELAKIQAEAAGKEFDDITKRETAIRLLTTAIGDFNEKFGQTTEETKSARAEIGELQQQQAALGIASQAALSVVAENALSIVKEIAGIQSTGQQAAADIVLFFVRAWEALKFVTKALLAPISAVIKEVLIDPFSAAITGVLNVLEGNFAQAKDDFIKAGEELVTAGFATVPTTIELIENSFNDMVDNTVESNQRILAALGLTTDAMKNLNDETLRGRDVFDFDTAIQQLSLFSSESTQLAVQSAEALKDYNREIDKIDTEFGGKITDVETSLRQLQGINLNNLGLAATQLNLLSDAFDNVAAEKLADAIEKFNQNIADLEEDLAIKLGDIQQDLEDKQKDIREDAQDAREDATKKHNKKMEDIEEDHQKKINDINQRFQIARLKALIDRDARALFEAERRRDEDLRKAKEAAEEKRQDEEERAREEQERINEREQERLEDAEKAAEKQRRNAQRAADRRRRDLEDQLEEERETIIEGLEDELDSLRKQWEKRREETKKEFEQRLIDIRDNIQKQTLINKVEGLRLQAVQLANMDASSTIYKEGFDTWKDEFDRSRDDLQEWVDDINELNSQVPEIINIPSLPGTPGSGGQPPPPGGGQPPPGADSGCNEFSDAPLRAGENAPCFITNPNHVVCSSDGSKWICAAGGWRRLSGPSGAQAQMTTQGTQGTQSRLLTGNSNLAGVGTQSTGGTGGQIPVRIVVENDKTLEAIFKDMAYTAFIEVVE